MKRLFYLSAIILFAAGCSETGFKRLKSGLEYKIVSGSGNKQLVYGSAVKFTARGYYNDSMISTPYDTIPQFFDLDSTRLPGDYVAIFRKAKVGDSIVTRMLVDSVLKMGGQIPAYAKKGGYLGYRFRILDIVADKATAETMKANALKQLMRVDSLLSITQKVTDDKILSDYIAKNKINATKTQKGTYVEIQSAGEGMQVDSGKVVTVNYKGMTLDGTIFDQSYDATGNSIKPYSFVIGQAGAIEGWDDGLRLFKKGGKGRLFIPSGLGYGLRGSQPRIQPNQCLLFEVEVADVMTQADYQKKQEAENKKLQQNQPKPDQVSPQK